MIDKKVLNRFKRLLIGEKFKVGDKSFYFEGCGPVKIKFSHRVTGIDTQQASIAYIWVRYENLNPNIEEAIILKLRENGVSEVI